MISRELRVAMVCACSFGAHLAAAQGKPATLVVEGRANGNPSIAANGSFVAVAWSAARSDGMDIFVATSRDAGATFSAPTQVNAIAGDARVSGEQPPRVALVPGQKRSPVVVIVWTTKGASGTRLLTARSTDGGRSFGANAVLPGGEGEGNRGWQSLAVDSTGHIFALWLDHRETAMPAGMHHQEPASGAAAATPRPDPVEKANRSQLYFSALDGPGARGIARGVCYCCKTSLAAAGGNIYVVWRHVFPGNQRDIGFSISHDNGKTFGEIVRVSDDHWQFDGCPENGPAIVVDRERRAHVLWVTPLDGKEGAPLALYHAVSRDGRTFSARMRIPTRGPASHVQATLDTDGSLIITWDEIVSGTRRVAVARAHVDASGRPTFTSLTAPEAEAGRWYPVIATTSTGAVLAWTRQGTLTTSIGVARLR